MKLERRGETVMQENGGRVEGEQWCLTGVNEQGWFLYFGVGLGWAVFSGSVFGWVWFGVWFVCLFKL